MNTGLSRLLAAFHGLREQVLAYLESCRVSDAPCGTFIISSNNPPDLFASCYGAFILNLFGELDSVGAADREDWAKLINSGQRGDGYFDDPLNRPYEWQGHEGEKNLLLQSGLAISALALLGSAPRHRLAFLAPVLTEQGVRQWFDERRRGALSYGNSWSESISAQNLAVCLVGYAMEEGIDPSHWSVMDAYFQCLDELQDPRTGLWGTRNPPFSWDNLLHCVWKVKQLMCSPAGGSYRVDQLPKGLGTSFHIVDIYAWLDRPWRHMRRVVDSVLFCQHSDGLFNPAGGGGQCWDLDAVSLLVNSYLMNDYRHDDILDALRKVVQALAKAALQNPDGGFRNTAGGESYRKGNSSLMIERGESDLLSTWFRCAVLAMIDSVISRPNRPVLASWNFNEWGYLHLRR